MSDSTPINGNQADRITRHEIECLGLLHFTGEFHIKIISAATGQATICIKKVAYHEKPHPLAGFLPFLGNTIEAHLSHSHLHQVWDTGGCYLAPEES